LIWMMDEDQCAIHTADLRLAFAWKGDRWSHLLVLGQGGQRRSFADSIEQPEGGDPSRVLSPTFQDIHVQEERNAIVALLIGKSGPHHFSGSFHVSESLSSGERRSVVIADLADRCLDPIDAVASTYQVHHFGVRSMLVDSGPTTARWTTEAEGTSVSLDVTGASGTDDAGPQAGHLALAQPNLQHLWAQITAKRVSDLATRQWSYRWVITRPADSSPDFLP
jgi:hypothetical protein